jgi:hypothetical protein
MHLPYVVNDKNDHGADNPRLREDGSVLNISNRGITFYTL